MLWMLSSLAVSGQLACGTFDTFSALDTRDGGVGFDLGYAVFGYDLADVAYDPGSGIIFAEAFGIGFPDCLMEFDVGSGQAACTMNWIGGGVALSPGGAPLLFPQNVEWFPPASAFIGLEGAMGQIIGMDQLGATWSLAPYPAGFGPRWSTVAWDSDLRVLWLIGFWSGRYNAVALNPVDFEPVVWSEWSNLCAFATTGIDDTPAQDPILFVSGTCPGELTVTVADATPGSTVQLVSSTRRGRAAVPSGGCAGTRTGLAGPRLRASLVANDYGLATTVLQATAPMCGAAMLQALDVDSCLPTEVDVLPAAVP